jgi:hypothetical protein
MLKAAAASLSVKCERLGFAQKSPDRPVCIWPERAIMFNRFLRWAGP